MSAIAACKLSSAVAAPNWHVLFVTEFFIQIIEKQRNQTITQFGDIGLGKKAGHVHSLFQIGSATQFFSKHGRAEAVC